MLIYANAWVFGWQNFKNKILRPIDSSTSGDILTWIILKIRSNKNTLVYFTHFGIYERIQKIWKQKSSNIMRHKFWWHRGASKSDCGLQIEMRMSKPLSRWISKLFSFSMRTFCSKCRMTIIQCALHFSGSRRHLGYFVCVVWTHRKFLEACKFTGVLFFAFAHLGHIPFLKSIFTYF